MHELDRRSLGVLSALLLLLPSVAWASPSAYRRSLSAQGLRDGFPRSTVTVLKPRSGPGREEVAKRLLAILPSLRKGRKGMIATSEFNQKRQDDDRVLSYVGEKGYWEIYDDGTKFRFRGEIDRPDQTRGASETSPPSPLTETELESLGRDFIQSLSDLVPLGPGESLTFLGTRVLKNGGVDLRGSWTQEVVAHIAIFGREVSGIPVIGRGSKIAVWLDRRRLAVGLDADWPVYETTPIQQNILPWEELKRRVETAATSLAGSPDRTISRFECGYVDLGSKKRSDHVQAGCAVFYDGRGWARFAFVPAGVEVLEDRHWPLADWIVKGGVLGAGQDPGPGPALNDSPY